jgi:two-component system, OmpR family, sensor histidine kinase PrrB
MRLSTRIAIAVGCLAPLLVLAAGWLLLRLVGDDLHAQQDQHLRDRATATAPQARALLRATAADRPAAVEQARERRLFASALDLGIRVVGPEGTVSDGPQPGPSVALPAAAPEPITVRDGDQSWRALSRHVTGPRPAVDGTLWVFSPDTTDQAQLRQVRRRVLTVALLAAVASALLAWAVATHAVRPLRRLQRRTSGLDPRTNAARLAHTPTRVTEIDDLARTLQTVLARYDEQATRTREALDTARSFSSAAAHELRTPLMSMQTNLEILTDHPGLAEPERAEILDDLRHEHARLLGLLVMLRELGRGDLVEADAFGSVDLAEVLDASAAQLRRRHPGARITVTGVPGLRVHGWEPGLRTVVDNLIGNALVHGRTGAGPARVEVALRHGGRPAGSVAVLTVDDHGPGIPPHLRPAVFERFHRRQDSPGSGLGLTLVAQQVALHHGRITVGDRPDGAPGTRFEVRLPFARDAAVDVEATTRLPRDWLIGTAARADARSQGFHKEGS